MFRNCKFIFGIVFFFFVTYSAPADEIMLLIKDTPAHGLVAAQVDFSAALRWCKLKAIPESSIRARLAHDQRPIPIQFVADDSMDPQRLKGTVILKLPGPGSAEVVLEFPDKAPPRTEKWDGKITTPMYSITHDPGRLGGFPAVIHFPRTGKQFQVSWWANRLHHQELGSFQLANDARAKVDLVANGPLCSVVRIHGRFMQGEKQAPSQAKATYDWFYFHDEPMVFVQGTIRQKEPFTWHEHHFLEMQFPVTSFPNWAGGEPVVEGKFTSNNKSFHHPQWGAVSDGRNAVAMFTGGQILFHDPVGGRGNYLQAHGDLAWQPWSDTQRRLSTWLWIGSADKPIEAIRSLVRQIPDNTSILVTTRDVHRHIQEAAAKQNIPGQKDSWWLPTVAGQLEALGYFPEAIQATQGKVPPSWVVLNAGDLGLILERRPGGIRLLSLTDLAKKQALAASRTLPLFNMTMQQVKTKEKISLTAEEGWQDIEVVQKGKAPVEIRWSRPHDKRLTDLQVVGRISADEKAHALRWHLGIEKVPAEWSGWRVIFPQLAVHDLGKNGFVLFPKAAGEIMQDPWRNSVNFHGVYPGGWVTMPFMAAYQPEQQTGLYCGYHDPLASTRDIDVQSKPVERTVRFGFDTPLENMGEPANQQNLQGESVWQLFRGDWFDAALIYRAWVRKEARWFPILTKEGRDDTPLWMRQLPAWALGGGPPKNCVPSVKAFAAYLDVPIGFHWYSWHQIPFDNDYPHYFPAREGFAEGVKELQNAGVHVMPYINGRLWDTHDRGKEDFEFTKVAGPAVTRKANGEPYVESYGSKESDGSPVRLGVMCPTTSLWQQRLHQIVSRLYGECGVKGVYIDQIAAASPVLCFARGHGHPLGGGHWWTEGGYWPLMKAIRQSKPADRMLTTECNADPYIHLFDGYLTWHWQYDGQVPAFPAVYGGAIQMFGRQYGGGPTRDLALRMRAGQQLVFGEQIGWLGPEVIKEKDNAAFLRKVIRLRWQLRRYFYAGEMARPPKLLGEIPRVRADWQWGGERWVTTDAVLTGCWRLPAENKFVILAVNVSDQPVTTRLSYDARVFNFPGSKLRQVRSSAAGSDPSVLIPLHGEIPLTLPERTAWAWEISAEN